MKISGKIEDGTSNKSLNFGSDPWPVCLSVSMTRKLKNGFQ